MDQKKIVEVLKQLTGRNISVSSMYEKINTWRDWLTGEVDGFYEYTMSVDLVNKRTAKMKRHRTDMFKRACEDWASLLLNELTRFEMDEKVSEAWLQGDDGNGGILGDNDFRRNANELIMVSRWAGTAAFEAYIEGGTAIAESGQLLSGKDIGINFLSADQIIPISHRNGIMKEVAFVSEQVSGDVKRHAVSMHLLEGDLYTIFYFTIDENGKVIDAPVIVRTGSPVPWFSVIRKAGYNRYDPMGPFGVGILDGNEDVLKGLDTAFDNFIVDFTLGRKMVFMNSTLFAQDDKGRFIAPQMMGDSLFINVGDRLKSEKSLLEEYNPQLRVQENADGVQRMLDIFSFKIGLGKGFYKLDEDGMVKTATEYTGSKQGLVRNVAREMIGIEAALKQLIEAVLWIGENILHIPGVKYEEDVRVVADDSYIVDEYTERKVWQEEVAQGLRSKAEYRKRFMGESDEEAAKAIQAMREETPMLTNLLEEPTE
jgi:hypothetical protein